MRPGRHWCQPRGNMPSLITPALARLQYSWLASPARQSVVPHHTRPAAVRKAISLIQTAAKSAQERSDRPIIANRACLSGKGVSDASSGGHITRNTLLTMTANHHHITSPLALQYREI